MLADRQRMDDNNIVIYQKKQAACNASGLRVMLTNLSRD